VPLFIAKVPPGSVLAIEERLEVLFVVRGETAHGEGEEGESREEFH
jgi:hypothetical protein